MLDLEQSTLFWTGGELDSDGSVGVYAHRLKVIIQKSIKSETTVKRMQDLYGGTIVHSASNSPNAEKKVSWIIRSEEARQFCEDILPYVRARRPQFQLASTLPTGRSPLIAAKGTETRSFKSFEDLTRELHINITASSVRRRFLKRNVCKFEEWTVSRLSKTDVLAYRSEVEEKLKNMKHVPHLAMPYPQRVHLAYFCGFAEGDGCFSILGANSVALAVSQTYSAIPHAFREKFGGSNQVFWTKSSKCRTGGFWVWNKVRGARAIIEALLPYAFEKQKQMELILSSTPENWRSVKTELNKLKGRRHVTYGVDNALDGVDNADKLSEDVLEVIMEERALAENLDELQLSN